MFIDFAIFFVSLFSLLIVDLLSKLVSHSNNMPIQDLPKIALGAQNWQTNLIIIPNITVTKYLKINECLNLSILAASFLSQRIVTAKYK